MMKRDFETSYLFGANAPFIEELYDSYLHDPASVPAEWKAWFDQLAESTGNLTRDISHQPVIRHFEDLAKRGPAPVTQQDPEHHRKQVGVLQLINAHRFLGSRRAQLSTVLHVGHPPVEAVRRELASLANIRHRDDLLVTAGFGIDGQHSRSQFRRSDADNDEATFCGATTRKATGGKASG